MVEVDGILHRIISDAVAHELPRRLATSAARQQGLNIQHPEVVREEIARQKEFFRLQHDNSPKEEI